MIDMLVSLNADLASSIAFRYACRMAELVNLHMRTIHVEEVEKEGYPPGSGWVRSTWEKGLLRTAEEEISQLINMEKSSCQPLEASIVRIGDREEELLQEIQNESYDLLLEGVLSSFDEQLFHQKVRSKLYRLATCPIILVKNLVTPSRVALLLAEHKDVKPVVGTFLKIFDKAELTLDLVFYSIKKGGQAEFRKKIETEADETVDAARVIAEAKTMLAENGRTPAECWMIQDRPQKIGELLASYGLVAARVPRSASKNNSVMEVLSRVPSATLLSK